MCQRPLMADEPLEEDAVQRYPDDDTPQGLVRLTVNVTPGAMACLHQLVELTGSSLTDAVCRALAVGAFVEEGRARGGRPAMVTGKGTEFFDIK